MGTVWLGTCKQPKVLLFPHPLHQTQSSQPQSAASDHSHVSSPSVTTTTIPAFLRTVCCGHVCFQHQWQPWVQGPPKTRALMGTSQAENNVCQQLPSLQHLSSVWVLLSKAITVLQDVYKGFWLGLFSRKRKERRKSKERE